MFNNTQFDRLEHSLYTNGTITCDRGSKSTHYLQPFSPFPFVSVELTLFWNRTQYCQCKL